MEDVYENGFSTDGLPDPAPLAPFGFHGEVEGDDVHLYWTPNVETDLAGYNLYRDGEFLASFSTEETNFLDEDVPGAHTYELTASDANSSEGPPSTVMIDVPCCECADCNEDGSADILDALWEVNCILGNTPPPCSCDCNQDGSDNILDVLCIVNMILSGACP
jgi:hypothetical protein